MRAFHKKTVLILLAFLLLNQISMALIIQNVDASSGWLSGWTYRKRHYINGAVGAGTDYSLKIRLFYDELVPSEFTFVNRWNDSYPNVPDAHQGVATDGTYFWVTNSYNVSNVKLSKWHINGSLIAEKEHCEIDGGGGHTQINHVHLRNGIIYAGANNYPSSPGSGWILEYDASDLSYITTHSVGTHRNEGCAWYDDAWWCVYGNNPECRKYDSSWNYIDSYSLDWGYTAWGYQAIIWMGDYIYLPLHRGSADEGMIHVYFWNGNGFDTVTRLYSPTFHCTQGLSLDPTNSSQLWWAERYYDNGYSRGYIVNSSIDYINSIGANDHCLPNFGDIRFTDDNGMSELDYWIESECDYSHAIIWIEVADTLDSDTSICMYYGNETVENGITTSNASETFLWFDDFTTDTSSLYNELVDNGEYVWNTAESRLEYTANITDESILEIKSSSASDFAMKSRISCRDEHQYFGFYMRGDGTANNYYWMDFTPYPYSGEEEGGQNRWRKMVDSSASTIEIVHPSVVFEDRWHVVEGMLDGIYGCTYTDDVIFVNETDSSFSNGSYGFRLYAYDTDPLIWCDWILVRKYTSPEPTHGAWGPEGTFIIVPIEKLEWYLDHIPMWMGIGGFLIVGIGPVLVVAAIKKDDWDNALLMLLAILIFGFSFIIAWLWP